MKKHKEGCACIFCTFKCPDCSSSAIRVTYSPVFTCNNDNNGCIKIMRKSDTIRIDCESCGEFFELGGFFDEKVEELKRALSKQLKIPAAGRISEKRCGKDRRNRDAKILAPDLRSGNDRRRN